MRSKTEYILAGLPAMMSLEKAAFELSVSRRTISRLTRRWKQTGGRFGLGPVYRVGNKPLLATRSIVEYLDAGLLAEEVSEVSHG